MSPPRSTFQAANAESRFRRVYLRECGTLDSVPEVGTLFVILLSSDVGDGFQ